MLLLLITAVPLMGALVVLFQRNKHINIPLLSSAIVLVMSYIGLEGVFGGESVFYKMPLEGPFAPSFKADPLTAIFVLLATFLWFVVSIYTPKYMKHEGKIKQFQICTLLTQTAVLGVFLAGDLLTMLLFFELMTISSYFWVVHRWNKNAIRAGYFYLFYSITGGLLIALGIVMLGSATDVLPAVGVSLETVLNSKNLNLSILLTLAGFGIKAGMAPLHLWLPHAHSAAPTPGSALLSGLLIKVGAYGIIRLGQLVGWGGVSLAYVSWLGPALTIIGIITMLVGVMAALLQSDAKRLLAYHSVSQMGYILLGLGLGLYLGKDGGLGLLGAVYHIINHGLFKVALFLGIGVIYINTRETNLYKLGGLWRRFPITALLMLIAVLGITGAPGLNGYASKTLIHHAVSQVADSRSIWTLLLEGLFLIVGVGTAASFSKLYYLIFFAKPSKLEVTGEKAPSMQLAMGLLAMVMVIIGAAPRLFPRLAAIPAVTTLGINNIAVSLDHVSFWNIKDIMSMVITLTLGILVCWVGLKSGLFHWNPPVWLKLESILRLFWLGGYNIWRLAARVYHLFVKTLRDIAVSWSSWMNSANRRINNPKGGTIGGMTIAGIGADIAVLILVLVILIVSYIVVNPALPIFATGSSQLPSKSSIMPLSQAAEIFGFIGSLASTFKSCFSAISSIWLSPNILCSLPQSWHIK
jgi:hydrogenase-4 component B